VDYGIIEFLVGIVTIVGFMYKFEKDTRVDIGRRVERSIGSVGDVIVVYLGLKGILDPKDVYLLRTVIKGLASTATNPFTEADRRRLLELVDKDDLTIEEAEELHRLAWKFYEEYIDKTPDAFKVLFYAAAMRGITYRKHALEKQTSQPST